MNFNFDACQIEDDIFRNFAIAGRRMFMAVFPTLFLKQESELDIEVKFSLKNNSLTGFYYYDAISNDEKEKYINACYENHSIYDGLGLDIYSIYHYVYREYGKIMNHNIALMKIMGNTELAKKMQADYNENIEYFNEFRSWHDYNAAYLYGRVVIPSWINNIENLSFCKETHVFEPNPDYNF